MPLLVDQPACKATREVTVSGYIRHLRAEPAGRGGEAGRSKLKAFRNRVLAIAHRWPRNSLAGRKLSDGSWAMKTPKMYSTA